MNRSPLDNPLIALLAYGLFLGMVAFPFMWLAYRMGIRDPLALGLVVFGGWMLGDYLLERIWSSW